MDLNTLKELSILTYLNESFTKFNNNLNSLGLLSSLKFFSFLKIKFFFSSNNFDISILVFLFHSKNYY